MYHQLVDEFVVPRSQQETWEFFSRAENLPEITPPSMKFRILTPGPIELKQDSLIDYSVTVMGLPVHWRTRIIDWSPPRQFIDLQISGPYSLWHHQHTFEETEGGTLCRDRVIYKVPVPMVGWMMNRLMVQRQLREIFEYRRVKIRERLGWVREIEPIRINRI